MTEKELAFIILFVLLLIVLYIYYDCNRIVKKARKELEEIGFEFDEKGNIK